jgi:hypothetical protein
MRALTRRFGDVTAVDAFTIDVQAGQVCGRREREARIEE